MKRLLLLPIYLIAIFPCFGQTVDTSTIYKKIKWDIDRIKGLPVFSHPSGAQTKAYAHFAEGIQSRVPFLTMAEVRAGKGDGAKVIHVNEGKKSGMFAINPAKTTGVDDGAMTLVNGTNIYERIIQGGVSPLFFGAAGDSLTNDYTAMQAAAVWASFNNKTLLIDAGYVFTIFTNILTVTTNIDGYGTIKTVSGALIRVNKPGASVKNITITGKHQNVISGCGLYLQYAVGLSADKVTASFISKQAIYVESDRSKVSNCVITETRGEYGDGVYFKGCKDANAFQNYVTKFQRIGIVYEDGCENVKGNFNICKDFIQSIGAQINNGIWAERVKGADISDNYVENTGAKGIVITPNSLITQGRTYTYTFDRNKVVSCKEGFNFVAPQDQILNARNGIFIDCNRGMEIGQCLQANISGFTFSARDSVGSKFVELFRMVPITTAGKVTTINIDNCVNSIPGYATAPIFFGNTSGQRAMLRVTNCLTGDWSARVQPNSVIGSITYNNSNIDYTWAGSQTGLYLANATHTRFIRSSIKMIPGNQILTQGASVVFDGCTIFADSTANLQFGNFGTDSVRIENSKISNIKLFNIRKVNAKIYLNNNEFTKYQSEGIFNTVVVAVNTIEARGNKFSSVFTNNPAIQLVNGAANSSFGVNAYTSASLTNSGFTPTYEMAVSLSNSATSAPTKTSLNAAYGKQRGNTNVTYKDISGGARSYRKLDDSETSDWENTEWATGNRSLATP